MTFQQALTTATQQNGKATRDEVALYSYRRTRTGNELIYCEGNKRLTQRTGGGFCPVLSRADLEAMDWHVIRPTAEGGLKLSVWGKDLDARSAS